MRSKSRSSSSSSSSRASEQAGVGGHDAGDEGRQEEEKSSSSGIDCVAGKMLGILKGGEAPPTPNFVSADAPSQKVVDSAIEYLISRLVMKRKAAHAGPPPPSSAWSRAVAAASGGYGKGGWGGAVNTTLLTCEEEEEGEDGEGEKVGEECGQSREQQQQKGDGSSRKEMEDGRWEVGEECEQSREQQQKGDLEVDGMPAEIQASAAGDPVFTDTHKTVLHTQAHPGVAVANAVVAAPPSPSSVATDTHKTVVHTQAHPGVAVANAVVAAPPTPAPLIPSPPILVKALESQLPPSAPRSATLSRQQPVTSLQRPKAEAGNAHRHKRSLSGESLTSARPQCPVSLLPPLASVPLSKAQPSPFSNSSSSSSRGDSSTPASAAFAQSFHSQPSET